MTFVTPGMLPVGAARDLLRELMSELFPTLGKPTTPTMICYLVLPLAEPSTLA
jgi:hypothetical protein